MINFPTDVRTIAVCGDWHMNTFYACNKINEVAHKADVFFHLGDFGYTFDEKFVSAVHEALENNDKILMFIDGNHDDFDFLESIPLSDDGVRRVTERIWHIPRGFRWEWSGKRFLALGGAISIDRHYRVSDLEYWAQEAITLADVSKCLEGGEVDIMFTHDAPNLDPMLGYLADWIPPDIEEDCDYNRELLASVVEAVNPRYLWHGHYHLRYVDDVNVGTTAITQTGLDCDGALAIDNIEIVNLEALIF